MDLNQFTVLIITHNMFSFLLKALQWHLFSFSFNLVL